MFAPNFPPWHPMWPWEYLYWRAAIVQWVKGFSLVLSPECSAREGWENILWGWPWLVVDQGIFSRHHPWPSGLFHMYCSLLGYFPRIISIVDFHWKLPWEFPLKIIKIICTFLLTITFVPHISREENVYRFCMVSFPWIYKLRGHLIHQMIFS